jgi:hypothetical protein
MVRPDLRREMASISEISSSQDRERERDRCGAPRENVFTMGGSWSLVGNPVPRDESKLRPSIRVLRK